MPVGAYIGLNGQAKKVKEIYVGVNGAARKVIKGYAGVDGLAKLWWTGSRFIGDLAVPRDYIQGFGIGKYACFIGGSTPDNVMSNIIDIFDGETRVRTNDFVPIAEAGGIGVYQGATVTMNGEYGLYIGGYSLGAGDTKRITYITRELTKGILSTSLARRGAAAAYSHNADKNTAYIMIYGGLTGPANTITNTVECFNGNLTKLSNASVANSPAYEAAGGPLKAGQGVIFGGGISTVTAGVNRVNATTAYNANRVKTSSANLSVERSALIGARYGKSDNPLGCVFAGGQGNGSNASLTTTMVEAFTAGGTKIAVTSLEQRMRWGNSDVVMDSYPVFAGFSVSVHNTDILYPEFYSTSLVKGKFIDPLIKARGLAGLAYTNNGYLFIAGGVQSVDGNEVILGDVEVFDSNTSKNVTLGE